MKRYSLDTTPFTGVSHDPSLKKQVLMPPGELDSPVHISHIILPPGATAIEHSHKDKNEIFYGIRGLIIFTVNGKEEPLRPGELVVVEPGESHSIKDVPEESEMLYLMT
ncbi:cupin domain-containing protein [Nitrospirota bacterium]